MKFKAGDIVNITEPDTVSLSRFGDCKNLEIEEIDMDGDFYIYTHDKLFSCIVFKSEGVELVNGQHDFMWAVEQMKQGKKVRRNHWQNWEGFALHNADGIGLMFTNNRYMSDKISISDIEATDWEIFEEEITWEEITKKIRNQLEVSPESPTTIRLNSKVIKILENQILRHTSRGGDKITRIFNMFLIEDDTLKDSEFLLSDEERCKECGHLK
jgi:hypothetical protein